MYRDHLWPTRPQTRHTNASHVASPSQPLQPCGNHLSQRSADTFPVRRRAVLLTGKPVENLVPVGTDGQTLHKKQHTSACCTELPDFTPGPGGRGGNPCTTTSVYGVLARTLGVVPDHPVAAQQAEGLVDSRIIPRERTTTVVMGYVPDQYPGQPECCLLG